MSAELLLIFIVALIVFGPDKLPMLARHLGIFVRTLTEMKNKALTLWQMQLNELTLKENQRKAEEADQHYTKK